MEKIKEAVVSSIIMFIVFGATAGIFSLSQIL
ncbi:hypothetical protein HNQ80_001531 [Anaerosolibacter carboniphilus]|uniref:Uncharacterized protein n=1 Tax=Anaerosolibacter carboniphilus TaxID=1417629 RepID=A0A841KWY5_9FIRM|nr:hypothetical protein [Anaerosolibacter carboniphilus]